MSKAKHPDRFRVTTDGPDYVGLLGEKLAELTVLRAGALTPLKPPPGHVPALFDFVVTADTGVCFLVQVGAYSSFQLKIEPESIPVLELEVSAERVRAARQSATPVLLFLFDGDRGHGRYLRLDTTPEPAPKATTVVLSFPIANTITADSIRALAAALEKERAVPVAG